MTLAPIIPYPPNSSDSSKVLPHIDSLNSIGITPICCPTQTNSAVIVNAYNASLMEFRLGFMYNSSGINIIHICILYNSKLVVMLWPHVWYAIIMEIASDTTNSQNNFIPKRCEASLFLL